MSSPISNLSPAQLRRVATIKEQIAALESQLSKLLGVGKPAAPKAVRRKRRRMSAEARAKIAAAQRARWAAQKAGKAK